MRIIRIFTRGGLGAKKKLNSKTAFFRILGVGSANALTLPVPISTISTTRFFAGFLRFFAVALLYISVDFSHHNSVQMPV